MIVLWLLLAAAAGFTASHYRLPARAWDRLLDWTQTGSQPRTARRFATETTAALLLLAALATRPRRTLRNIRSWRKPQEHLPTPEMGPNWGRTP